MSDLISRQKAINTAENMYGVCDTGYMTDYKDLVIEALEDLPSAERKGHWILKIITVGFPDWLCSECGKSGRGDFGFCPWCGARMEGDTE